MTAISDQMHQMADFEYLFSEARFPAPLRLPTPNILQPIKPAEVVDVDVAATVA